MRSQREAVSSQSESEPDVDGVVLVLNRALAACRQTVKVSVKPPQQQGAPHTRLGSTLGQNNEQLLSVCDLTKSSTLPLYPDRKWFVMCVCSTTGVHQVEQLCSYCDLCVQEQVCNDVAKRLRLLEDSWRAGRLSLPVRRRMDTLSLGNLSHYTSTCLSPEHLSEYSPVCLSSCLSLRVTVGSLGLS